MSTFAAHVYLSQRHTQKTCPCRPRHRAAPVPVKPKLNGLTKEAAAVALRKHQEALQAWHPDVCGSCGVSLSAGMDAKHWIGVSDRIAAIDAATKAPRKARKGK